jgi:ribosomal protein S12 methylthiotransferase accessory factor YcaO
MRLVSTATLARLDEILTAIRSIERVQDVSQLTRLPVPGRWQ